MCVWVSICVSVCACVCVSPLGTAHSSFNMPLVGQGTRSVHRKFCLKVGTKERYFRHFEERWAEERARRYTPATPLQCQTDSYYIYISLHLRLKHTQWGNLSWGASIQGKEGRMGNGGTTVLTVPPWVLPGLCVDKCVGVCTGKHTHSYRGVSRGIGEFRAFSSPL